MRPRSALPFVAAVVTAGVVGAAASSLGGLSGPGVGADAVAVGSCSQSGINSDYVLVASTVTAIRLTGFPSSCLGQTVAVAVAGSAGTEAEASVALSGSTALLTLPHPVAVSAVSSLSVVVTG
jgi:hypothetical protein